MDEKKYGEGGATPPSFDCDAEEVIGVGSMVFNMDTLNALVDYFTQLTSVIQDPGSIAQITAKELPNRIRFSSGMSIFTFCIYLVLTLLQGVQLLRTMKIVQISSTMQDKKN